MAEQQIAKLRSAAIRAIGRKRRRRLRMPGREKISKKKHKNKETATNSAAAKKRHQQIAPIPIPPSPPIYPETSPIIHFTSKEIKSRPNTHHVDIGLAKYTHAQRNPVAITFHNTNGDLGSSTCPKPVVKMRNYQHAPT